MQHCATFLERRYYISVLLVPQPLYADDSRGASDTQGPHVRMVVLCAVVFRSTLPVMMRVYCMLLCAGPHQGWAELTFGVT
jgi:hypothetical protein